MSHPATNEFERMIKGQYFNSSNDLYERILSCHKVLESYNSLRVSDFGERSAILKSLVGSIGQRSMIVAPFYCDYGVNIALGNSCFVNYDCVFLDSAPISVGDHVFIGPQVGIYTSMHPIDADLRGLWREKAKSIIIKNNVWIGGHATLCPGVTINEDVVIGAGSVVTNNIPSHVIAVGNPCHILHEITDEERQIWQHYETEYQTWMKLVGKDEVRN